MDKFNAVGDTVNKRINKLNFNLSRGLSISVWTQSPVKWPHLTLKVCLNYSNCPGRCSNQESGHFTFRKRWRLPKIRLPGAEIRLCFNSMNFSQYLKLIASTKSITAFCFQLISNPLVAMLRYFPISNRCIPLSCYNIYYELLTTYALLKWSKIDFWY